ncbi:MAG: hypothetical protein AAF401_08980 [Pseudomonadota bacterium]
MLSSKAIIAAAVCAAMAAPMGPLANAPVIGQLLTGQAQADSSDRRETRRQVRRTIRRIDRRQDRRDYRRSTLPANCVRLVINGFPHWRCGSLYYREVIDNGATVFIVVEL